MPLVLAAVSFVAGYILAKLGALLGRASVSEEDTSDKDRALRSAEAELRVAQKKIEEAEANFEAKNTEAGELRAELEELREEHNEFEEQTTSLRDQLRDECEKTQKLRTELSERAEAGIRTEVKLRDAETELSLAQAGSDAINDEIQRLAEEREELTNRLKTLQQQADTEASDDDRPAADGGFALDY
ncbi:MAG: hypothetical protein QNJ73_11680 [Gammaproteobacteria bacterium]|nr:hypothetical protein [Gammaproteobacteria bacterium]